LADESRSTLIIIEKICRSKEESSKSKEEVGPYLDLVKEKSNEHMIKLIWLQFETLS
jgi:hypothetical protein